MSVVQRVGAAPVARKPAPGTVRATVVRGPRSAPGSKALKQIKESQKKTVNLFPADPFKKVVQNKLSILAQHYERVPSLHKKEKTLMALTGGSGYVTIASDALATLRNVVEAEIDDLLRGSHVVGVLTHKSLRDEHITLFEHLRNGEYRHSIAAVPSTSITNLYPGAKPKPRARSRKA